MPWRPPRAPGRATASRTGPPAWLMTAARRRVLDRLRAEAMAARKEPLLVVDAEAPPRVGSTRADPGDLVELVDPSTTTCCASC